MRRLIFATLAVAALALGAPSPPAPARVPPRRLVALMSWSVNWDAIAMCESGMRWHLNTGNGFYGGLQFSQPTWLAYRRSWYPWRADLAWPWQQKRAAERVLIHQGLGAWPICGARG